MARFKATQLAFFEGRRMRPGTVFHAPADFGGSWAVPVEDEEKKAAPAKKKRKKRASKKEAS